MGRKKFNIKRCFILLLILMIVGSYVKVEIQTLLYGEQFEELYDASGWIEDISYFKVMKYSGENADIFYVALSVEDGSPTAKFLYHFKKESGNWTLDSWKCLDSKSGNAEKFYWPFYPYQKSKINIGIIIVGLLFLSVLRPYHAERYMKKNIKLLLFLGIVITLLSVYLFYTIF